MIGYKYHGFQRTDAEGRYEFTCIIPGCYEPRGASHLHVKVQGNSQPITTQLYIEGVPGNEDDHYYSSELLVHATEDANGTKHGSLRLRDQAGHGAGERHAGEPRGARLSSLSADDTAAASGRQPLRFAQPVCVVEQTSVECRTEAAAAFVHERDTTYALRPAAQGRYTSWTPARASAASSTSPSPTARSPPSRPTSRRPRRSASSRSRATTATSRPA